MTLARRHWRAVEHSGSRETSRETRNRRPGGTKHFRLVDQPRYSQRDLMQRTTAPSIAFEITDVQREDILTKRQPASVYSSQGRLIQSQLDSLKGQPSQHQGVQLVRIFPSVTRANVLISVRDSLLRAGLFPLAYIFPACGRIEERTWSRSLAGNVKGASEGIRGTGICVVCKGIRQASEPIAVLGSPRSPRVQASPEMAVIWLASSWPSWQGNDPPRCAYRASCLSGRLTNQGW